MIAQAAKFQVEFYFGQTAYYHDDYLKKCCDPNGWIPLSVIYDFRKIRQFHSRLSIHQLYEVMKLSSVVDVKEASVILAGSPKTIYYIRKKNLFMNEKYLDFIGYNIETIKMLKRAQFEEFMRHKREFENQILSKRPIIVTTMGKASTKNLRNKRFTRVIIDEATMVKENEAFLGAINAEQIVLVGDQKQLGPTYTFKIDGPSSLFSRLIQAGHPFDFLDI